MNFERAVHHERVEGIVVGSNHRHQADLTPHAQARFCDDLLGTWPELRRLTTSSSPISRVCPRVALGCDPPRLADSPTASIRSRFLDDPGALCLISSGIVARSLDRMVSCLVSLNLLVVEATVVRQGHLTLALWNVVVEIVDLGRGRHMVTRFRQRE